jgi:hypothetical protein
MLANLITYLHQTSKLINKKKTIEKKEKRGDIIEK